jgi:hypothetical protein
MGDTKEIILNGLGSDISCDLFEPIIIPTEEYDAKLGLKSFATYNNIPNIEEGKNNYLKIKVPGDTYRVFSLETGAYELDKINDQIVEWIKLKYPKLTKVDENFKLEGNKATCKAEFILKGRYGVGFDVDGSMAEVLGFERDRKIDGSGRYVADKIINIVNVKQIVFNCSLTVSNYVNGKECPFIYNCGVNVPVGYRLTRELTDIAYKKLTTSQIAHIRVWVVDENGVPVNLRQDDLTVTLSLKLTPKTSKVKVVKT